MKDEVRQLPIVEELMAKQKKCEVRAGEEHRLGSLPQAVAADARGQGVAVGDGFAIAREVGAHTEVLPRAAHVEPEAGADIRLPFF